MASNSRSKSAGARAHRHGNDFEWRIARQLKGTVYKGLAGDVLVGHDIIVECKYLLTLQLTNRKQISTWIAQAQKNASWWSRKGDPRRWLLVFTPGGKNGVFVCMPQQDLDDLVEKRGQEPAWLLTIESDRDGVRYPVITMDCYLNLIGKG
jgi:hypothetical protein